MSSLPSPTSDPQCIPPTPPAPQASVLPAFPSTSLLQLLLHLPASTHNCYNSFPHPSGGMCLKHKSDNTTPLFNSPQCLPVALGIKVGLLAMACRAGVLWPMPVPACGSWAASPQLQQPWLSSQLRDLCFAAPLLWELHTPGSFHPFISSPQRGLLGLWAPKVSSHPCALNHTLVVSFLPLIRALITFVFTFVCFFYLWNINSKSRDPISLVYSFAWLIEATCQD